MGGLVIFIKNKYSKDVCIQAVVINFLERNGKKLTHIKGWYWNMGVPKMEYSKPDTNHDSFNIGEFADIEISEENLKNWKMADVSDKLAHFSSLREVVWEEFK